MNTSAKTGKEIRKGDDKIPKYNLPVVSIDEVPGKTSPRLTQQQIQDATSTSSGGSSKSLIFSRDASVGTGNQSFTGFGFAPTNYTIISSTTVGTSCNGGYDGASEIGLYINDYAGYVTGIAYRVMQLRNSSTLKTYAKHEELLADGIELDFTNSDIDTTFIITCHS